MRGNGPPLVLIQGVGVCGSGWDPQVDALGGHYTCLTFDNRGMGASQPAGARLSLPRMAADTLALMDAQGWDSAHIAGHSMGGLIALELALTAPKRVRSLTLLCTFARGSDATRLSAAMVWIGLRTRIGPRASRRRAFLELVSSPNAAPKDPGALASRIGELFGHDLADTPPVVMAQLSALRTHDVTARLGELAAIPTLVVSAQYDRIAPPASGKAIAAGIPGARYVEIPDAAHGVPILDAGRVNSLIMQHLAQQR